MLISNYYAEELLHSPLYFSFYRTPKHIGLLESAFRAVDNGSRACPPQEGLSSGGLARRLSCPPSLWRSGGVADWRACPPCLWRAGLLTISWPDHSHEGKSTIEGRLKFISCFRTYVSLFPRNKIILYKHKIDSLLQKSQKIRYLV